MTWSSVKETETKAPGGHKAGASAIVAGKEAGGKSPGGEDQKVQLNGDKSPKAAADQKPKTTQEPKDLHMTKAEIRELQQRVQRIPYTKITKEQINEFVVTIESKVAEFNRSAKTDWIDFNPLPGLNGLHEPKLMPALRSYYEAIVVLDACLTWLLHMLDANETGQIRIDQAVEDRIKELNSSIEQLLKPDEQTHKNVIDVLGAVPFALVAESDPKDSQKIAPLISNAQAAAKKYIEMRLAKEQGASGVASKSTASAGTRSANAGSSSAGAAVEQKPKTTQAAQDEPETQNIKITKKQIEKLFEAIKSKIDTFNASELAFLEQLNQQPIPPTVLDRDGQALEALMNVPEGMRRDVRQEQALLVFGGILVPELSPTYESLLVLKCCETWLFRLSYCHTPEKYESLLGQISTLTKRYDVPRLSYTPELSEFELVDQPDPEASKKIASLIPEADRKAREYVNQRIQNQYRMLNAGHPGPQQAEAPAVPKRIIQITQQNVQELLQETEKRLNELYPTTDDAESRPQYEKSLVFFYVFGLMKTISAGLEDSHEANPQKNPESTTGAASSHSKDGASPDKKSEQISKLTEDIQTFRATHVQQIYMLPVSMLLQFQALWPDSDWPAFKLVTSPPDQSVNPLKTLITAAENKVQTGLGKGFNVFFVTEISRIMNSLIRLGQTLAKCAKKSTLLELENRLVELASKTSQINAEQIDISKRQAQMADSLTKVSRLQSQLGDFNPQSLDLKLKEFDRRIQDYSQEILKLHTQNNDLIARLEALEKAQPAAATQGSSDSKQPGFLTRTYNSLFGKPSKTS